MNIATQFLMNQLQQKNPQGYQTIQKLMKSNSNPQELLQQVLGNATPEQRQGLFKQAKQYGVPTEILAKLQNMK